MRGSATLVRRDGCPLRPRKMGPKNEKEETRSSYTVRDLGPDDSFIPGIKEEVSRREATRPRDLSVICVPEDPLVFYRTLPGLPSL